MNKKIFIITFIILIIIILIIFFVKDFFVTDRQDNENNNLVPEGFSKIYIDSTPQNAEVYIGKEKLLNTPGETILPFGTYYVWISTKDYLPIEETVNINKEQEYLFYSLDKAPVNFYDIEYNPEF